MSAPEDPCYDPDRCFVISAAALSRIMGLVRRLGTEEPMDREEMQFLKEKMKGVAEQAVDLKDVSLVEAYRYSIQKRAEHRS